LDKKNMSTSINMISVYDMYMYYMFKQQ
jgi:hypothetical protein